MQDMQKTHTQSFTGVISKAIFSNGKYSFLSVMKINTIIIVLALSSFNVLHAYPTRGQSLLDKQIVLELHNEKLSKALDEIQRLSKIRMGYSLSSVLQSNLINVERQRLSIRDALNKVLNETSLAFKLQDETILIFSKPERVDLLSSWVNTGQYDIYLEGITTDENGQPLYGVSINVSGKQGKYYGTTDAKGRFRIAVSPGTYLLTANMIGYAQIQKQIETNAGSEKDLGMLVLKESTTDLNQVVVVGYGTTSKRNNTGSVATVDAKDIATQPVTDPMAALQGRVTGLQITATNGMPGASYSVRIRGTNSLTDFTNSYANEPLYIIDGVPYISEPLNQFSGGNGTQSPLASISPSDIERIDVLKDADATAIYGSRAANGVVLITTKKGKAGKTQVSFNVFSGISKVTHIPNMLNTKQYLAMRREAFANDSVEPTELNAPDLTLWDSTVSNNWPKKLIGNTAHFTDAQTSISGGNEQTQFLLGGTYHHESTVLASPYGYDRGSVHLNINHISKNRKFNVNATVTYSADKNNILGYDISQYYDLPPNYPIYDSTGNFYWFSNIQNPIAYLQRKYVSKTDNLIGNALVRYTLLPGLDIKANLGYNKMNMNQTLTMPERSFNPAASVPSEAQYGFSEMHSYVLEPQATYTKKLAKGTLQALAGGTWQQQISEGHSLEGTGYPGDGQLDNMASASTIQVLKYNYAQYRYTSVFGRINYNWEDKYIINGSFRRDGSSRFGPNRRFGNFGAVGAAWIFSDESFIKNNLSFLSFGKLRTSYGITGNDKIGDYSYLDSWSPVGYAYGGITGISPSRLYNPDYGWETNKKFEAGLELGFLNGRIMFNTAYYRNRSGNQLIGYTLSPQTGFNNIIANLPALVQNEGWEFELNTINFKGRNFNWTSSVNLSINKNELLKYPGLEGSSVQYTYVIGQPLDVVQGFGFTSTDPKTGLPEFKDANGDSTLSDPDDYVVLGHRSPNYFGGLNNTVSYKKWSLSFLFQFVKQEGPGLNYGYTSVPYGTMSNKSTEALRRWASPGDNTSIPRATATSGTEAYSLYSTYYRLSSAVWGDASYIRLKNISLSYDLSFVARKWKISECAVYFQAQNVFTITGYKGFDPETQGSVTPPLKTFTAGIRFSL